MSGSPSKSVRERAAESDVIALSSTETETTRTTPKQNKLPKRLTKTPTSSDIAPASISASLSFVGQKRPANCRGRGKGPQKTVHENNGTESEINNNKNVNGHSSKEITKDCLDIRTACSIKDQITNIGPSISGSNISSIGQKRPEVVNQNVNGHIATETTEDCLDNRIASSNSDTFGLLASRKAEALKQKKTTGKTVIPEYKIVEGTTFAVDAFRYGDIAGVTDYFLSHFHADHYIGLKKSFDKPLYCSKITACLVKCFLKVDEKYIRQIDVNESFVLEGVTVYTLEANQ